MVNFSENNIFKFKFWKVFEFFLYSARFVSDLFLETEFGVKIKY